MKRKRWVLGIGVFVLLNIVASLYVVYRVHAYKVAVSNITFSGVDLSSVADGSYVGDCDLDLVYAKVKVVMENGKIVKVDLLEHKNGRGASAERIVKDFSKEQKVNVDAVSGATNSSLAIKKAVDNALIKGKH